MKGCDYIAVVELSTKAGVTLAAPGESCARVADASLPWLLEQGLIVAAKPKQPEQPERKDA